MKLTKSIVFFDVETSGLSLSEDRIIEISMIKMFPNSKDTESYYKRINPQGRQINEEAFSKHGIKLEDLEGCPIFAEIAKEVYDFIKDCDLGGYNCKYFDIPILIEEFLRAKIYINAKNFKIVDVYKILSKVEPRTLEGTYKRFFGKTFEGAHNAESDIKATMEILEKMESLYELPDTVNGLHNVSFADDNNIDFEHKLKFNKNNEIVFNFGKYKDKTVNEVFNIDSGYFDWIVNKSDMTQYTKNIFVNVIKLLKQ
jgi:DNA polymerase III subunit epsilon